MKKTMIAAAAGALAMVSSGTMAATGEQVYNQACQVCHKMGIAGAPKLGDKAAWAPRIAQGLATMEDHAIKGFQGKTGVMPPKGGFMNLSDADVKAAVEYMTNNSK